MTDRGEVIGDPESGAPPAEQERGREEGRTDKPLTLDAEGILRKLDQRTPGLARPVETGSLSSSVPVLRPGGGSTMVGSLPEGVSEGGPELDDRGYLPDPDARGDGHAPTAGEGGEERRPLVRFGTVVPVDDLMATGIKPVIGMDSLRTIPVKMPDAGRDVSGIRASPSVVGKSEVGETPPRPDPPARTIPIRDAFPPGLSEDPVLARGPVGAGGADPGPGAWGASPGEPTGEGMGSRHGVSAQDLLKTNELLRQLVEETKRQRVASLPAAGPRVYPGR